VKHRKEYFFARSKKERAAILLAGVAMNFVLAVGITTYLLTQGVQEPTGQVHIERVIANSPAQKAGLKEGDIVTRVNEEKDIMVPLELITSVTKHAGEKITLTIFRDTKQYPIWKHGSIP
jgi:membrane-associated protease RseP (regulator of RpoE activity)